MSSLEVARVESRRDRDAFIKFPWRIYQDDPAWVPPLLIERKAFLDRDRHPFYRHGDAALFLARRDGEILGRIMASDDPNYNAVQKSNVGCFGLFETIDDAQVASALLETASIWLRRRGRSEIMGPIDYSTNYVCGLLVEGFQHPPTLLTSHNPAYYEGLIEKAGFRKILDFYAWWFAEPMAAAARLRRLATRLAKKARFTIRPSNLKNLRTESAILRQIYNEAWRDNWGYVPFTEAEFDHLTAEMKPLLRPELTQIAEVDGEAVGFIIALPDINVVLQKINGRLTTFGIPIGLVRLLYGKSRLLYGKSRRKKGRLIALGVRPEFRQHGVAEMLVLRIIEEGMFKLGFIPELSMTLETNFMINRFLEAIGADRYKTYRVYAKSLV